MYIKKFSIKTLNDYLRNGWKARHSGRRKSTGRESSSSSSGKRRSKSSKSSVGAGVAAIKAVVVITVLSAIGTRHNKE